MLPRPWRRTNPNRLAATDAPVGGTGGGSGDAVAGTATIAGMTSDRDASGGYDPQSFDHFAQDYDRYCELKRSETDWIASLGLGGSRALDAGCGSGRHAVRLAERFDQVLGVDLSAPLVRIGRSRRPNPRVRYLVADLMDFSDADGFDLVFSSTTLHHLPDLEAALGRLKGMVRPGGTAVLVDNVANRPTPPRWVYLAGAVAALPGDIRRFGWREAWWLLRFATCPPWLDHLASDRYLSRGEFERRYGAVFPGARYVDRGFAHALVWRRG